MVQPFFVALLGICLGAGSWQLIVWLGENRDKSRKYKAACDCALQKNKPLLVAGGPWGARPYRRWLRFPAHGGGDVCLDINSNAIAGHPNGVVAGVTDIPFADKCFGAAFASHLLEHLSSTEDARKALAELHRVAEEVFIVYPSRQSIAGWIIPDHHIWVWQKDSTTYFQQRGKPGDKSKEEYHN
ncbi:MAG: methyltransferase domain-containing protein [Chloroflexi bacterium]|nr:methyltransferase domain-containing protein [Chloroflexota bacterium]